MSGITKKELRRFDHFYVCVLVDKDTSVLPSVPGNPGFIESCSAMF